jgi:4-amino-4-deoxy-L-arabinose transferase-like glycosyltransferase
VTREWISTSRFQALLLTSLGLFIALRLIYWFGAFPNPDEAYYWLWGQHPELSYYDHPPLQAWLQGLSGALFGNTLFGLRLINLFTTLGLLWLFNLYLRPLMRERSAEAVALGFTLMLASPVMFAFLATAWPDHIMLFTSSLSVVLLLRFFDGYLADGVGDGKWLYLATFSLGLSAIAKYNSVFVALGIILTLISNPRLRPLWRDPRLYRAVALTLLVMSPLLWWNLQNHMASFIYQMMNRTVIGGVHRSVSAFDGLVFFLILVFTLSPFVTWMLYRLTGRRNRLFEAFAGKEHYLQLPLWIFAASTATFLFFSLFDPMLYYWNIVAYPLLFPLLAVFLMTIGKSPKAVFGHIAYGLLFAITVVFHTVFNPISAFVNRSGDQDSRMLYGWDQVTPRVQARLRELRQNHRQVVLMATDYRKASALAFTTGIKDVVCISKRKDEFDYWQKGKRYADKVALILYDDWQPINDQLRRIYTSIRPVETLEIRHRGVFIKRYYLAIGRNPAGRTIAP